MPEVKEKAKRKPNRYCAIIENIFLTRYNEGDHEVRFTRQDIKDTAEKLGIPPDNLGDVLYYFRYRNAYPAAILETAEPGKEWVILGAGKSKYKFLQVAKLDIVPRKELVTIKVPDSTPEIIAAYALSDEQALLAKVRYNRLIDIFLGITAYSLQNHLRTTVEEIGQIEIDEIYVGLDRHGRHFIVPTQAKGGKDKHSVVQTYQDIYYCRDNFKDLVCRAVSAQFIGTDKIAMFELTLQDNDIKVVDEKHYLLVPAKSITAEDLQGYNLHGG